MAKSFRFSALQLLFKYRAL